MLDFVDRGYFLEMGILQKKTIHKPAMNSDIDVFVDRGGNEEAAVLAVIRRRISSAAAKRDSQWRTRDNHFGTPTVEKLGGLVQRISIIANVAQPNIPTGLIPAANLLEFAA